MISTVLGGGYAFAARVATVLALACTLAGVQAPAADAGSAPTPGALYQDGQSGRYLLGGTWLYRADPADAGLGARWWDPAASTSGWSAVSIPNAYNAGDYSTASAAGSIGWYRRELTLPSRAFPRSLPVSAQRWIVRFESINKAATVWLNGRLIGRHDGANLPFELDLNGVRRGVNTLVVRVDSRRNALDLPPAGSGWWDYGGILREVYLRAVPGVDISDAEVTPSLPCATCSATINAQVRVRNLTGSAQQVKLSGRFGGDPLGFGELTIPPGGTAVASTALRISRPRLWTLDDPHLYRSVVSLADARGGALMSYVNLVGIRRIGVIRGRLTLNGRLLSLRGIELREQDAVTGALTPAQLVRLVSSVHALGARLIRTDEPAPQLSELADRLGLLLWSEIPVSGGTQGSELADPSWLSRVDGLLQQNILVNGRHPSILLWSIGNELGTPASANATAYIARAAALARALDPTRPVGMAVSDWPGVACQPAYRPLQVIGVNEYFGWYGAGGGTTDDRDALGPYLDGLRACYPRQALMISEFGFEANRPGPVEERGTYAFQSDSLAFHLGVFATRPWLSAAIYFLLEDAAGQPGFTGGNPLPDPPFVEKGLLDRYGRPKPAFAVLRSIYRATVQVGAKVRDG